MKIKHFLCNIAVVIERARTGVKKAVCHHIMTMRLGNAISVCGTAMAYSTEYRLKNLQAAPSLRQRMLHQAMLKNTLKVTSDTSTSRQTPRPVKLFDPISGKDY